MKKDNDETRIQTSLDNLVLELRRGTLVLAVLGVLHERLYGYALVELLALRGFSIDPGTLYPLLRRLEKQGLLVSEWETGGPKPRKYYVATAAGLEVRRRLMVEWRDMARMLDAVCVEGRVQEEGEHGSQK